MRSRPECWAPKSGSGQTFPAGSGLWKELCGFRQTPHLQHCFLLSENGEFSLLPSDSWLPGPECHQKQNAVDILGNPELWILILALLARTACVALAASPLHLGHARLCIHGGVSASCRLYVAHLSPPCLLAASPWRPSCLCSPWAAAKQGTTCSCVWRTTRPWSVPP